MKLIVLSTLLAVTLLGCSGGEAGPEAASATTETTGSNYGDRIVNAKKKAQKMADEQSERAKGVDQVLEDSSQ